MTGVTEISEQFEKAALSVKSWKPSQTVSNQDKLKVYALFKQGKEGDVNTTRPGMFDMVGKAKWDAWHALKGKSKEEAMKEYIEEINRQQASYA